MRNGEIIPETPWRNLGFGILEGYPLLVLNYDATELTSWPKSLHLELPPVKTNAQCILFVQSPKSERTIRQFTHGIKSYEHLTAEKFRKAHQAHSIELDPLFSWTSIDYIQHISRRAYLRAIDRRLRISSQTIETSRVQSKFIQHLFSGTKLTFSEKMYILYYCEQLKILAPDQSLFFTKMVDIRRSFALKIKCALLHRDQILTFDQSRRLTIINGEPIKDLSYHVLEDRQFLCSFRIFQYRYKQFYDWIMRDMIKLKVMTEDEFRNIELLITDFEAHILYANIDKSSKLIDWYPNPIYDPKEIDDQSNPKYLPQWVCTDVLKIIARFTFIYHARYPQTPKETAEEHKAELMRVCKDINDSCKKVENTDEILFCSIYFGSLALLGITVFLYFSFTLGLLDKYLSDVARMSLAPIANSLLYVGSALLGTHLATSGLMIGSLVNSSNVKGDAVEFVENGVEPLDPRIVLNTQRTDYSAYLNLSIR